MSVLERGPSLVGAVALNGLRMVVVSSIVDVGVLLAAYVVARPSESIARRAE